MRASKLRKVSAFSRAQDGLRVQTVHGGVVTLLGVTVSLVLFLSELSQCMTVKRVQQMEVDTIRREQLHIVFNLTFPGLPCEALTMDVVDASGTYESDDTIRLARNGEVHKYTLDRDGRRLGRAEYVAPAHGGWGSLSPFILAIDQQDIDAVKAAIARHEGCNIFGWLDVDRLAGTLHFTVRQEALFVAYNMRDIFDLLVARHMEVLGDHVGQHPDAGQLNASHVIHTLRFGPPFPGMVNPLEGVARIDRKATGVDKYFIKVVPADYYSLWGRHTHTSLYSVTEYYQALGGGGAAADLSLGGEQPAVWFGFDTSPIRVVLRDTRAGVARLLVRLCAVVGGAFALTGLLDRSVHWAVCGLAGGVAARAAD